MTRRKAPTPTPVHDELVARIHQALMEGDLASTVWPVPPPVDRGESDCEEVMWAGYRGGWRDPDAAESLRSWLEASVPRLRKEIEEGRLGRWRGAREDDLRYARAHLDRFEKALEELRRGVGPQPPPEWWAEDIQWEHPIANQRGTVIGYVDLCARLGRRSWVFDARDLRWDGIVEQHRIYFEVKPEIPSVGELLRQINKYRHYREGGTWVVVTPSDRYAGVLASQDVKLLVPNRVDQQQLPFGASDARLHERKP